MGEWVKLAAEDGHDFGAYVARPEGEARAGMLVLQEIFGVNAHIRDVTDRWAARGYLAIAPALFDRVRPGVELGYEGADLKEGAGIRAQIPIEKTLADMTAAMGWLRGEGAGKIFAVGYCWGGSLAWWANTRLGADASSSYYGGMIAGAANEKNNGPAMFHFGALDKHIGADHWERIRSAHPELPLYVYDADHGFNCDRRAAYNEAAAKLALERTLALFHSAE